MKLSESKSEIALVLVIVGAIGLLTTGFGVIVVISGLVFGLIGIEKAPSLKKRNLGILAVVGAIVLFVYLFISLMNHLT